MSDPATESETPRTRRAYQMYPMVKQDATLKERAEHCRGWMGYAFAEHKEAIWDASRGHRENNMTLVREALMDAHTSMKEWYEACWHASFLLSCLEDSFYTASHAPDGVPPSFEGFSK